MSAIDVMSDSTGKAIAEKLDQQNILLTAIAGRNGGLPIKDWSSVQSVVRMGLAPKVFALGDQLVCSHETYGTLVWDIIGFDQDVPADATKEHSMTIQLHSCCDSLQFDATEALYYAEEALAAGTYNFTLLAGYDTGNGGGKTYQFTLAKPVPKGGQIMFPWAYGAQAIHTKVSTYENATSTEAIETVSVTEGNEGTPLTNTNHTHRIRYGSNRWGESAIRQWLNSPAGVNAWWKPFNSFDRPPSYASSKAGFLSGLDTDFLAVVGSVTKRTALDTEMDGKDYEDLTERFFFISRGEVYSGNERGAEEGNPYLYYTEFSDFAVPGVAEDENRMKYRNGSATNWWLRSRHSGNGSYIRVVTPEGSISSYYAFNAYGVAPACNII